MMKRFIVCLLVAIIAINITACAKCISTESKEVEVTISDSYHRNAYTTMMKSGKTIVPITHPAVYRISVSYKEKTYTVSGSDTYKKFKDKIGEKAYATLIVKTYDNGKTYANITEIK